MKKAAVLMMEGFEESETIQIVDLLRRAGVIVTKFCFHEDLWVHSMQGMDIKADAPFDPETVRRYDIIIVPGGRTSWTKLMDNTDVMNTLRWFNENNKLIGAMCSGTKVAHAAGVMKGKTVTGYTGYDKVLTDGNFVDAPAVWDQNLITSPGPATPYPFAFKIMEALGIDNTQLKQRLLYNNAGGR
ncbi:MAG: DJ-1/PfpI family protein [Lactimicrobium sp.]|jgi:4-methyl-5(b-hydroxyethyl)-thiazole monophosphate biosynthesis|uniref:DJ-1/PfpI family protein n=1 Tax=Lactimicrobium sp. TaxID=2563780 RepID=UPI002F359B48